MKLSYLALPNGKKLIPYHRHDFKSEDIDGVYYFIDGEASSYIRTSHPNLVKSTSVNFLLPTIREEFTWTALYDKDLNRLNAPVTRLLKDLDEDHIEAIIVHLKDRIEKVKNQEGMSDALYSMKQTIEIMCSEIRFRNKQNKTK